MSKAKQSSDTSQADALPWSPVVRRIVSVVLAFHVAAVFIAPWSGPPPSSSLSQRVASGIRPYLDGLGLNNGYRFFAPIPGPSHIVRYRLHFRDGSTRDGQFPDLDQQWPRLLYHRYLMLAERVHVRLEDPPVPPKDQPGFFQMPPHEQQRLHDEFQRQGRVYNESRRPLEALVTPIANRLIRDHDAEAVELWSVEHRIPFPRDVIDGIPLNDQRYYVARYVGYFQRP